MTGLTAERPARQERRAVLIVAAMAEELGPLHDLVERGRLGGTPVILARTGEGCSRATATTKGLLDRLEPALVLVIGIAGALSPELGPGDLVVADEVRDGGGPVPAPDPAWVERALELGGAVAGTAISSTRILCTPSEKAAARRSLPEDRPAIVDLETAAIARIAAERNVPYLVLRAVSDRADEDLPLDLNRCRDGEGGISRLAVVGRALAHPSSVRGLWRLRRRLGDCARALAVRVRDLLDGAAP